VSSKVLLQNGVGPF